MKLIAVEQYNTETQHPETIAQLVVSEAGVLAEDGEEADMVRAIPVIDPESGDQVTSDSEPLRWADLLPTAFRSGGIGVAVTDVEDTPIEGEAHLPNEIHQGARSGSLAVAAFHSQGRHKP